MSRSTAISNHSADLGEAAVRLQQATQTLFEASDDPVRDRHCLLEPLRDVVIRHKSRKGQAICARLARALVAGDDERALAACRALIALETAGKAPAR